MKQEFLDSIYEGKIMQRTWTETSCNGIVCQGTIETRVIKERAPLYKTANGYFVDLAELQRNSDFRGVNKINLKENKCVEYKKRICVMPAILVEDIESSNIKGNFVIADTLIPYIQDDEIKQEQPITKRFY